MAFNPTPPAIVQADFDGINEDIEKIIERIVTLNTANIALTADERKSSTSVGKSRKPFNDYYYGNKAGYPDFKPSQTKVSEANADKHYFIHNALSTCNQKLSTAVEMIADLQLNSEHFSFDYSSAGRKAAKTGKENGLPGADSWFDSLDELYPQSNGPKTDSGEPTPNA